MMDEMNYPLEQFTDWIIFMSLYNEIVQRNGKNKSLCSENSALAWEYARTFPKGHWSFSDQDVEKNGMELTHKPDGAWNHVAEIMMLNFRESGHPVFRGSRAVNRGTLKSKGGGTLSIHWW